MRWPARFTTRFSRGLGAQPWIFRHKAASVLAAVAVVGAGLAVWRPWQTSDPCGNGLTAVGSPYHCVGLDEDSGALQADDPLAGLETRIARLNSTVPSTARTVVLLENLTPDPSTDSYNYPSINHAVEGAIVAATQANSNTDNRIRLLLANFGSGADQWQAAVSKIKAAKAGLHIVAVVGLGQSNDNTNAAAAALSNDRISVIGAEVTADSMGTDPVTHERLHDYFSVAPVNADEASAAAHYIAAGSIAHRRLMVIWDKNTSDTYPQTLLKGFTQAAARSKLKISNLEPFVSPGPNTAASSRSINVEDQFSQMRAEVCAQNPDLIYFAGRGVDLSSFIEAMDRQGACPPLAAITIVTGDDASNLVNAPPPAAEGQTVKIYYPALAYPNQWNDLTIPPADLTRAEASTYALFSKAFGDARFGPSDSTAADTSDQIRLTDGVAMIVHDAVETVTTALQHASPGDDDIEGLLTGLHCANSVLGVTGYISLNQGKQTPMDKAMPILQILLPHSTTQSGTTAPSQEGTVRQTSVVWPGGTQADYLCRAKTP
jgi:ABC-type branched-subunit amino acid transport system substrate-binding protein